MHTIAGKRTRESHVGETGAQNMRSLGLHAMDSVV